VPEEINTDNGKQFTDRFGRHGTRNGEVLFDKICRRNGIAHRLTAPASPNQNGKVERFHGTFRPEFLDTEGPFTSVGQAQAAVDAWVQDYNADRPHQALDQKVPVTPAERFAPVPESQRSLVDLWLPAALEDVGALEPARADASSAAAEPAAVPARPAPEGGAVEFDRVVPLSGNLQVAVKQFWLGPARAGTVIRFWADCDLVHLSAGGVRLKTLRSHLSPADLLRLAASGAVPAGPCPLPQHAAGTEAVEVERPVSRTGLVSLARHRLLAAEILAGQLVGIRIEPGVLMFFDPATRFLLRTRPSPLTPADAARLRGARPAGPPPQPSADPVRVQRRVSSTGVVMIAGQKIALGRIHAGQTVAVLVADTALTVELGDGETRAVGRTAA
jgi:hypothetical protein